jgi:hypothetical protein
VAECDCRRGRRRTTGVVQREPQCAVLIFRGKPRQGRGKYKDGSRLVPRQRRLVRPCGFARLAPRPRGVDADLLVRPTVVEVDVIVEARN